MATRHYKNCFQKTRFFGNLLRFLDNLCATTSHLVIKILELRKENITNFEDSFLYTSITTKTKRPRLTYLMREPISLKLHI